MRIRCPSCWVKNTMEIEGNYEVITSHPIIAPVPQELHNTKIPFWMFWVAKYPEGVREGTIECRSCGHPFYVGLFPYGHNDPRNKKDLNYYLSIIKGENPIETKFLLEDILDHFSKYFRVKYPLNCFLIGVIFYMSFCMIPGILLGGFSKISHDYLFPFIMFLPGFMLFFLKRHYMMLQGTLNFEKLPFLLSEEYKGSNLGKQLEETLRGWIFGHPFQKMRPPTFCGLAAIFFLLAWMAFYTVNICNSFYETPYTGFPVTYTSYVGSVISIPFWILTYFVIGNITWFFLVTNALVGLIARHSPLKINPLKRMGGTEIFGKMVLSSVYMAAVVGAGLPFTVIWGKTQELYVLLLSVVLVMIFVFIMISGFFYSLWPIHQKLGRIKDEETNRILNMVSLPAITKEIDIRDAIRTHLFLDTSNKVSSMTEWPFKTDTFLKLSSSVLIPIISLIINIIIFAP